MNIYLLKKGLVYWLILQGEG
uniref:Uncharacterized protein n=1 Tax=Anguilla anguilla TaxID=7936 RepID=A0A0E9VZ93_ANGAN